MSALEPGLVARRAAEPDPAREPQVDAARLLRGLRADGLALTHTEHVAVHGAQPGLGHDAGERLVRAAGEAGLLGRGGGRFPIASKLEAVRGATRRGRRARVVVNAAESEPASRKDAVLVGRSPHLVLDGAELAAAAVGAREVVVWLHQGDADLRARVERAFDERRSAGAPRTRFTVVEAPVGYVAGEASAAVRALSGGPARPTTAPPRVARRGVDGRPTLLSNAETLAHLALVARYGPGWFREVGPPDEPGTLLLTVAGAVRLQGVVEAPVGATVAAVLAAAGGVTSGPSAVLVGGYAGSWLRPDELPDAAYSVSGLGRLGASPGAGVVTVLPAGTCPVTETARLTGWLAGESAGQCGPCRNGLPALAGAAAELAAGSVGASGAPGRLARWSAMVEGRGACHHPDGVAGLVTSLLRAFPGEVAEHAAGRPCRLTGPRPTRAGTP